MKVSTRDESCLRHDWNYSLENDEGSDLWMLRVVIWEIQGMLASIRDPLIFAVQSSEFTILLVGFCSKDGTFVDLREPKIQGVTPLS